MFEATKERMGRHPNDKFTVGKVRKGGGKVGSRKAIPPPIAALLKDKWRAILSPATACDDFAAFRTAVAASRAQ